MTAMTLPRPEVGAPEAWPFPLPRRHTLANGINVLLHHLPGQHVISTNVVLDHSVAAEHADQEGITALFARTVTDGTVAHPGERFAELLENAGAAMGQDVGQSGVQFVMDVPATHLAIALPLMAEAVREPQLDDTDIRRQIELRLAEIAQMAANSSATASLEYRRRVINTAARASRPVGGEREQVSTLTPELVRRWAESILTPSRASIVLGGDLGGEGDGIAAVIALLEDAFGDWTGPAVPAVAHQTPSAGTPGCTVIDRPGAVQADIHLGGWGVDRFDPRWPSIRLASYAMGGAFNSRLNTVLREEKGYTYGARLGFTPMRAGGWFAAQGSFRTEVVGDALVTAHQILDVSGNPFTHEEIGEAQRYLTGTTPLQYATADGVVDQAALQLIMDLPDDYLDRSLADVLTVTPAQATDAYRSVIDLDNLTCVVVGDAEALLPQLEAAGIPAEVITPDA